MFTEERHRAILELLTKKQRIGVRELQRKLKISSATLRRDLSELELANKLVRVHGGAVHPQYLKGELSFEQKSREALAAKRAMGVAAAELVQPQQTVFIDSGTSCFQVARALASRADVTIVTNCAALLQAAQDGEARLVCIGGELRAVSGALVGALALSWLGHLRADWAFIGASGLSETDGASTTELNEAAVKQAMIERATQRVLVADASKWDQPATTCFAPWETFTHWVTDDELNVAVARRITDRGVKVVRATSKTGS
jgi:DeoR/GlpR family transcriptional regulator of sugar metabolism